MAKQEIDIGIEGNDGTGDSIRESFRKVNENFDEVYAVFGLEGQVNFSGLSDTPGEDVTSYTGNEGKVLLVNQTASGIGYFEFASDGGDNDPLNPLNTINVSVSGDQLIIKAVNTKLSTDPTPTTSAPLKINSSAALSTSVNTTLRDDGLRSTLVTDWNTTHGSPNISEDELLVTKGYTDDKYVSLDGDTMTGTLSVPAGATGTQVPQVSEVVSIDGDTMTGALTLHDHPYPFQGAGTPNNSADLQAATKLYVDSSSYTSSVNLYVTLEGDDSHANTPPGKNGRSPAYSYRTINAAANKASTIIEAAPTELGPLVQDLTYQDSGNTLVSDVLDPGSLGYSLVTDQVTVESYFTAEKQNIIDDTITYITTTFPDLVYSEALCRRDLGLILDSILLDIKASTVAIKHNLLSRKAGLRYYANPSAEFAISTNGQYTETSGAITYARSQVNTGLSALLGASNQWTLATLARFDDILAIIDSGQSTPALAESDSYYNLFVNSGPNKYTDQAGDPAALTPNVDIIPGKLIRGKTSGAVGRIVSYARGVESAGTPDYEEIEVVLVEPVEFSVGEDVEYANSTLDTQVTIIVETGVYEEQFPIRLPVNTSIEGDQFRRTIIRPAPGRTTSSVASTYFYRDATIDGNTAATGGDLHVDATSTTVGYYGYHYLTDPQVPSSEGKYNSEIDTFLLNDGCMVRNITVQGHGGFMAVLDPAGAVKTRSPFIQSCTSYSQSLNEKAFRGGLFVDGFCYNMPVEIVSKTDNFTLQIQAPDTSGLGLRKPSTPCAFYVDGIRYQVNSIESYVASSGGNASATLNIDANSKGPDIAIDNITGTGSIATVTTEANHGLVSGTTVDIRGATTNTDFNVTNVSITVTGATTFTYAYTGATDAEPTNSPATAKGYGFTTAAPVDIILQGAGNKSVLANDFTQVNDLGYGIVVTNNALSEIVSVFTYYCNIGYYSSKGGKIRALNGNNSYGNYGMVSEGSDPDEIARTVTTVQALTQPLKLYVVEAEVTVPGDVSASLTVGETISQGGVSGELVMWSVDTDTTLYIQNVTGGTFASGIATSGSSAGALGTSNAYTLRGFTANQNDVAVYAFDATDYPANASELKILHTSGAFFPYDVVSVSDTGIEIPTNFVDGTDGTLCESANTTIRATVWKLDLTSGVGDATGLTETENFGTQVSFKNKQTIWVDGISNELSARPSTALSFDENSSKIYRTLAFDNTIAGGVPIAIDEAVVTIDQNFINVDLNVDNDRAGYSSTAGAGNWTVTSTTGSAPAGGATLGGAQNDNSIAIAALDTTGESRIIGKIFTWDGMVHTVTGYTVAVDDSGTGGLDGVTFGIVTFTNLYDTNTSYAGSGLASRVDSTASPQELNTIGATLPAGSPGNVVINISLCRATGHDFLDIGTGGFNDTNYPERIYGPPIGDPLSGEGSIDREGSNLTAQVQERTEGRVFFASTDQDGFFRVGPFFTVDQGTGSVTFNAALVLTNIDGIGFKRGVRVNEFSADDTFTSAAGDTVATELATEGYINRRLGWDRNGTDLLAGDIIGPGAFRADGGTPLTGPLSMGGNQINNLATPTSNSDAATKGYVDGEIAIINSALDSQNELAEMTDTDINSEQALANNHFLVYNTTLGKWTNALYDTNAANSDFTVIYDETSNNLEGTIASGVINNSMISASAAIAQSKLDLADSTAAATAGAATKGISSFDSADFDVSAGYASIKNAGVSNDQLEGSITNGKLQNSSITVSDGTSSTAISLGGTVTFSATANETTVDEVGGTVTIGLPATITADVNGTATNADTATVATTTTIAARNTTNATHYLTFTASPTGDIAQYTDTSLTWNPSTNTLSLGANDGDITNLATLTFEAATGANEIIFPDNLAEALVLRSGTTARDLMILTTTDGAEKVAINGGLDITGNITPNANAPTDSGQQLGASGNRWNTVYATTFNGVATEALYADLAENYLADGDYGPGTVLVLGGAQEVTTTNLKQDTKVAGVVTTNPAHLMNSNLEGEFVAAIALQGRVPCKVIGKVCKGDLLVTSATPGYAIVPIEPPGVGTIIGKAIQGKDNMEPGVIEVMVGRV